MKWFLLGGWMGACFSYPWLLTSTESIAGLAIVVFILVLIKSYKDTLAIYRKAGAL